MQESEQRKQIKLSHVKYTHPISCCTLVDY